MGGRPVFWKPQQLSVCFVAAGLLLLGAIYGDVKSSTGNINFDSNADGASEATLSSSGLGIGTTTPSANLHVAGNAYLTGNMGIGTSAPTSTLQVSGSLGYAYQSVSANATLGANTLVIADSSSTNITLTLPYAGNVQGRQYLIKKKAATGTVYVSGGGNLVDTDTSITMTSGGNSFPSLGVISNGQQWYITSQSDSGVSALASSNLIVWWKFDQSSGNTVADSSGNQLTTGTRSNFASVTDGWVSGKVGNALQCDGVDDWVAMDYAPPVSASAKGVSIALWLKVNNSVEYDFFIDRNASVNSIPLMSLLRYTASGNLTAWCRDDANHLIFVYGNPITTGVWTHVVITRKVNAADTLYSLYENGALVSSQTDGDASTFTMQKVWLANYNNADYPAFVIDDFRIYNKTLSAEEILAIYQSAQ